MKAEIDWRKFFTADVCPSCPYYNECGMNIDCKAMDILVRIREDMDCGNTDW